MNAQSKSPDETAQSSQHETQNKSTQITTKIALSTELYDEINQHLFKLSTQIGFKVTLASFLQKTIADNWKNQLEYYHKLEKGLKRTRL